MEETLPDSFLKDFDLKIADFLNRLGKITKLG